MKKPVTKEMVQKWLDKKIATAKAMATEIRLNDGTTIEMCGVLHNELHIYKAGNVQKLAEFLEIPFEINDPWDERYPDDVEVAFIYKDWRIFGLDNRKEFYHEEAEVTD